MTRLPLLLALIIVLSGCMVGQRSTAPDRDGDELPDERETEGWDLTIVKTVWECFATTDPEPVTETRHVKSHPLRLDTDADGVEDFEEHFFRGDPNSTDTDGDGLLDGDEWELRSDESFFAPGRLGLDRTDSDEDCLTDKEEIDGFDVPNIGRRSTDPTTDDSDHDGFIDAWEVQKSFSDPTDPDTDDDGSEDRNDVDPLKDVWLRIRLTSLTGKDLPSSEERVELFWSIPAKDSAESSGRSGAFQLREGDTVMLTDAQSPGDFDVDDQRGGTTLIFEFYGRILDAQGAAVGILEINPHNPGQAVQVRYDVANDTWEFRTQSGYTAPSKETTLETSQARLTFVFEDFAAS